MRKIKNCLMNSKLIIIVFSIIIVSCEKEDFVIDDSIQESSFKVPELDLAKQHFEKENNFKNPFNKKSLYQNYSTNSNNGEYFFIDWFNSKQINFKKKDKVDILYTPVRYDKKGKKTKTFVASVETSNAIIESYIYTLYYADSSTDNEYSGVIVKFSNDGVALEYYKYIDGEVNEIGIFKNSKSNKTSSSISNKNSVASYSAGDCGEVTVEEILWTVEYLWNTGGGTYNALDCVEVIANKSHSSEEGGGEWSDPDINLISGGGILATGGGGSGGGSSSSSGQWWNTESVEFKTATANAIISAIPTLTIAQQNWVRNTTNHNSNIDIVKFLNSYNNSIQAQNFVSRAINAFISNHYSSFNEVLLNRTDLDLNSANDPNNNSIGGYDNTPIPEFNPNVDSWPFIGNVIPITDFVGWGEAGLERDCMTYAKEQLRKAGYQISNYGDTGQTFQVYTEKDGINLDNTGKGVAYLISALHRGIPVIVGVDYEPGSVYNKNTDNSTDHFVVIVGMGTDSNGKNYFNFFDNGSYNRPYYNWGASLDNKFYFDSATGSLIGSSRTNLCVRVGGRYQVTQIRKSKPL